MKVLTKNTDYAVRALADLAAHKNTVRSAKEISESQKIPYEFLRKILSRLIKNNIVESKEGGAGGFKLKTDPERIKLTDLIKIFQGKVQFSACMFRQDLCPNRKHCILRKNILHIEQNVIKQLGAITIASLKG